MSAFSTASSVALFRRLSWEGTIPLEIRIDTKELPAGSDRGLDSYYIQAPRVSYLPLLIPEIKKFLVELVFDDPASANNLKEEDWWFEAVEGTLMKWHWPLGLLYDLSITAKRPPSALDQQSNPLRLILHLVSPPTDKLLMSPSAEICKQSFMGQLKEADFLRWGNTKRVTGLRKQDQDGLWDSIREHSFDNFWRIASKITPTTAPLPASGSSGATPNPSTLSAQSRPPSTDPTGGSDRDGAYAIRSIPLRIFLPDGPVMQELVSPYLEDGLPHTLGHLLHSNLPLLFNYTPSLAYALVQGVLTPLESELGWIGACLPGADGWVNVCIGLTQVM